MPLRPARHRTPGLTAGATLAALLVLLGFARAGWPGTPNGCRQVQRPVCFCERPRAGPVVQPTNTFSNLGFVAAGLWIAAVADRRGRAAALPPNPLTRTRFYPATFAVVTALLGPGSMALHASLTVWGGKVDVASMYLYAGLLIAYGVMRLRGLRPRAFAALFGGLVTALVVAQVALAPPVEPLFGLLLATCVGVEMSYARRRPEVAMARGWLGLAIGLFGLAFAVWVPSLSGGALCDPDSAVQGHGVWHLLCAGSTAALFLYYRSERPATARP